MSDAATPAIPLDEEKLTFLLGQQGLPLEPYRGIAPFRCVDAPIFSGRESETEQLLRYVVMYRGVLFYGDSGVGKSSLINASFVPRALDEGFLPHRVRLQPRAGEEMVVERFSLSSSDSAPYLPSYLIADDDTSPRRALACGDFIRFVEKAAAEAVERKRLRPLLIFEQFEEFVTLFEVAPRDQAQRSRARTAQNGILDTVVHLLQQRQLPVKILFVFREDYLSKIEKLLSRAPDLIGQRLRLMPLTIQVLDSIIKKPLELTEGGVGLFPSKFSPALLNGLSRQFTSRAQDRDNTLNLTEVQIACSELWRSADPDALFFGDTQNRRSARPELGRGVTRDIGRFVKHASTGVSRLLEQYLIGALQGIERGKLRDAAIEILCALVTSAGTRNVVSREDILNPHRRPTSRNTATMEAALRALEENTGLVRREIRNDIEFYEIVSEFLVPWITEHKSGQQRETRRLQMQAKALTIFALFLLMVAVVLLVIWGEKKDRLVERGKKEKNEIQAKRMEAEHKRDEAENKRDAAILAEQNAKDVADAQKKITAQYKKEAEQIRVALKSQLAGIDARMMDAMDRSAQFFERRDSSVGPLITIIAKIVTDVSAENVEFSKHLDEINGQGDPLRRNDHVALIGHSKPVCDVAFSGDGAWLVTASEDKTMRLWNVEGHLKFILPASTDPGVATCAAFGPASANSVVFGTASGVVRLFDLNDAVAIFTGNPLVKPIAQTSAQGPMLVRLSTSPSVSTPPAHSRDINRVVYASNGIIATASDDRTVKLWGAGGRKLLKVLAHNGSVSALSFSPDGSHLLTSCDDGTARVWDTKTGFEATGGRLQTSNPVHEAKFYPQDTSDLAVAASGREVNVWHTKNGKKLATPFPDNGQCEFGSAIFSPSGEWVAVAGADGVVRLWRLTGESLTKPLPAGGKMPISDLAWSGDGRLLAAADGSEHCYVWDVSDPGSVAAPRSLGEGNISIGRVVWSPANHRLATFRGVREHNPPNIGLSERDAGPEPASFNVGNAVQIWDADMSLDQVPPK